MNKIYLIKKGNNGATYIFNTKDINSIVLSLEFYKTFTFRQYLVKTVLFSNLIMEKYFSKSKLFDIQKVKEYLKINTLDSIDFDIDQNSSILISPTNDKIIIHKHDKNSFIKYAFGNSLDGVKTIFESGRYISFSNKSYAMTIAQMYKYYDIIDYLNNIQGIKINAEFAAGKGDIKLLEIIKNKKQHLNVLHCLKEAAKYGEIESIKFLLNNYDVNDIDLKITIEATTNLYGLNNKLISDDEKEEIVKYILDNYELSLYQLDSLFYYTQERNAYGIRNIIEKKIKEISEIKLKNN